MNPVGVSKLMDGISKLLEGVNFCSIVLVGILIALILLLVTSVFLLITFRALQREYRNGQETLNKVLLSISSDVLAVLRKNMREEMTSPEVDRESS